MNNWKSFLFKENFDEQLIDSALQSNSGVEKLETHFVYAGYYYHYREKLLRSFIVRGMKKYNIQSVMVTIIYMPRWDLITNEEMENYCSGNEYLNDSVNDDLETFFEDLRLGKEPEKWAQTYFLPKLTEKELELIERKDPSYMRTFKISENFGQPEAFRGIDDFRAHFRITNVDLMEFDVDLFDESERKRLSDMKFTLGHGYRKTFTIENFDHRERFRVQRKHLQSESDSASKFIQGPGYRKTVTVKNSQSSQNIFNCSLQ